MRIEHQAGRAAALLSLVGLMLAPGAADAQQRDLPGVRPQARIPVRMVTTSHSAIPVRVTDSTAVAQLPTGEGRVFITNTPGSPLVTSVPGRPGSVATEPDDLGTSAVPGEETSWLTDDDGVAWLPQQIGQWGTSPEQPIGSRPQPAAAADLAGVRAYLSTAAGGAVAAPVAMNRVATDPDPVTLDVPTASNKPVRRLPTHASMNASAERQRPVYQDQTRTQGAQWAPVPAQPSAISRQPSSDFAGLDASLGGQMLRSPASAGGEYLLGPGDRVDVFVWRNAELSRQVPVRPDGYISLPLVGELAAAGKTAAELEAEITSLLRDFVQVPTVTVTVTDIKSLVVYVLGRVGTPGPVTLDRNINVLQAISMAGGPTEFANQNGITILRTIANQRVRIPYRYGDVMKGRADTGEFVLQSGDVIYVP